MNSKTILPIALVICVTGCGSSVPFFKKVSPFKSEEPALEPKKGLKPSSIQETEDIFVCAGDIDTTYKKLGMVSLGEFGFSGYDILAYKIREKARAVGAQAVIHVQYDTGTSKSWSGYGELGGTDYGIRHASWCKGMAIVFIESHNPLGLLVCNLTKENREWFNLRKAQNGVLVTHVLPESTAAHVGITVEDLITEWNGEKIENKRHLTELIQASADKEVNLALLRTGEMKTFAISVPGPAPSMVASPSSRFPAREDKPAITRKEPPSSRSGLHSADIHNEVGDLYLRKGMYDEAKREYKKAIEADPNCAIAYFNLSIIYDKKDMHEEADRAFATFKRLRSKRK
jgi:tetratricopeptide (TPR) repeat protein